MKPTLKKSDQNGEKYDHPAFGMISYSNVQGGDVSLFGSDIKHNQTVRLRIHKADLDRHLNRDWFHPKEKIVEVEMSHNQWASLIANGNTSGVPCTLLMHQNDYSVPKITSESKHEKHKDELDVSARKVCAKLLEAVKDLEGLSEGGSIKKKDFNEILKGFKHHALNLSANLQHSLDQHKEMMDKNVTAAKSDIEAHVTNKVHELGLESLKDIAPRLEDKAGGEHG